MKVSVAVYVYLVGHITVPAWGRARVSSCAGASWLNVKLKRITSLICPLGYCGKATVTLKWLVRSLRSLVLDPMWNDWWPVCFLNRQCCLEVSGLVKEGNNCYTPGSGSDYTWISNRQTEQDISHHHKTHIASFLIIKPWQAIGL